MIAHRKAVSQYFLLVEMTLGFNCFNRRAMSSMSSLNMMNFIRAKASSSIIEDSMKEEPDDVLFEEKNNVGIITLNRPKHFLYFSWRDGGKYRVATDKTTFAMPETTIGLFPDVGGSYFLPRLKPAALGLYLALTSYQLKGIEFKPHSFEERKYRVATDKTTFAMPETTIGLFPDVGGSYFLPRLKPAALGLYLALTSYQLKGNTTTSLITTTSTKQIGYLKGKDVAKCGIATHYIPSSNLTQVVSNLVAEPSKVEEILKSNTENLDSYEFSLTPHLDTIQHAFSAPTVEQIVSRLEQKNDEFSNKTLSTLKRMSPISMKITHKQLQLGAGKSLTECLKMEYRLA
ncbi:3-hydroxyisobutyryl-CoA hydrolase, mitochondrial-like [Diaphorina citri]|uniref:3-hydroxyisobutyryl-CoA hydrolase, mitochondrial n=1 Tax=Diaphorina citri TaxID=121845 RepID=A0A3Q0JFS3_DIACI|nr:3-hydroxyisobutyryl-CoA hydrolase, mitochondrial-like [Diaphorina citri]